MVGIIQRMEGMLINIVAVQLHYGRTMKLSFYEVFQKN